MSAVSGTCERHDVAALQQVVEGTCSAAPGGLSWVSTWQPKPRSRSMTAVPMRPVPTTPTVRSRSSLPRTSFSR